MAQPNQIVMDDSKHYMALKWGIGINSQHQQAAKEEKDEREVVFIPVNKAEETAICGTMFTSGFTLVQQGKGAPPMNNKPVKREKKAVDIALEELVEVFSDDEDIEDEYPTAIRGGGNNKEEKKKEKKSKKDKKKKKKKKDSKKKQQEKSVEVSGEDALEAAPNGEKIEKAKGSKRDKSVAANKRSKSWVEGPKEKVGKDMRPKSKGKGTQSTIDQHTKVLKHIPPNEFPNKVLNPALVTACQKVIKKLDKLDGTGKVPKVKASQCEDLDDNDQVRLLMFFISQYMLRQDMLKQSHLTSLEGTLQFKRVRELISIANDKATIIEISRDVISTPSTKITSHNAAPYAAKDLLAEVMDDINIVTEIGDEDYRKQAGKRRKALMLAAKIFLMRTTATGATKAAKALKRAPMNELQDLVMEKGELREWKGKHGINSPFDPPAILKLEDIPLEIAEAETTEAMMNPAAYIPDLDATALVVLSEKERKKLIGKAIGPYLKRIYPSTHISGLHLFHQLSNDTQMKYIFTKGELHEWMKQFQTYSAAVTSQPTTPATSTKPDNTQAAEQQASTPNQGFEPVEIDDGPINLEPQGTVRNEYMANAPRPIALHLTREKLSISTVVVKQALKRGDGQLLSVIDLMKAVFAKMKSAIRKKDGQTTLRIIPVARKCGQELESPESLHPANYEAYASNVQRAYGNLTISFTMHFVTSINIDHLKRAGPKDMMKAKGLFMAWIKQRDISFNKINESPYGYTPILMCDRSNQSDDFAQVREEHTRAAAVFSTTKINSTDVNVQYVEVPLPKKLQSYKHMPVHATVIYAKDGMEATVKKAFMDAVRDPMEFPATHLQDYIDIHDDPSKPPPSHLMAANSFPACVHSWSS
jgi:hypothetical protein